MARKLHRIEFCVGIREVYLNIAPTYCLLAYVAMWARLINESFIVTKNITTLKFMKQMCR